MGTIAEVIELSKQHGSEKGKAAGSWVIDGNTEQAAAQRILDGYEASDPEIMDMCPAPLSGEFAGEPIPSMVLDELGIGFDHESADEVLDAFEDAFSNAFWQEVIRSASILCGLEPCGVCGEYGHKWKDHV